MKKLKILLQSNLVWLFLFILLFSYVIFRTKIIKYQSNYASNVNVIEGKILKVKIDGDKVSLTIKTAKEKVIATYYLNSEEEKDFLLANLKEGIKVSLKGKKQDILSNTIFNTFSYADYLYNSKIYLAFLAEKIEIKDNRLSLFYQIKDKINKRIASLNNSEYLKAFILGDKNEIDLDILEGIKNNGVSHLFALSGLHVNFIWAFLKKIKVKDIFIYLFLIFYFILSGCAISFLRAILFMIALKLNKKYEWHLSNIQVLFLVAFLIILINPFIVYNLGFIYTFVITYALLLYSKYFQVKGFIKNTIMVSLITFLFSLPINIYLNYEINLLTFLFNIILVLLVSTIIFPVILFYFLCPIIFPIANFLINLLEQLNLFFKSISIIVVIGKISFLEIGIYYLILLSGIKKKKIIYILALFIIILIMKYKFNFDQNSYIYYLDVGQGDSIVMVMPWHKKLIMLDTGGKITYPKLDYQVRKKEFNLADNLILFLKSLGFNKINYLILSHGDYDHLGYSKDLVNNFKIKNVIFNNDTYNNLELDLIKLLNDKKINYYQNLKELNLDSMTIQFLNTKIYNNENDNSNVLFFKYYNYKFLFMGDAGMEREKDLLDKYDLTNIDFLKVGHHGSNTSSSKYFIDEINPRYAFISVGRNNRYGHPKKEVLDVLSKAKIYRTDMDGSIEIKINKKEYKIRTCTPKIS